MADEDEQERVNLSKKEVPDSGHIHLSSDQLRKSALASDDPAVPIETHVHLSRSGSVDIYATSPPRGIREARDGGGEHFVGGEGRRGEAAAVPPLVPTRYPSTMFDASFESGATPSHHQYQRGGSNNGFRVTSDAIPLRDSATSFIPDLRGSSSTLGGGGMRMAAARMVPPNAASTSTSSVTSSSKAVLSALRALQDKIKRLETERSVAIDEATRLRRHVEELEQNTDSHVTMIQDKHNSARMAYERLLAEKTAVDAKLVKSEEKRLELASQVNNLRGRLQAEEEARREADRAVKSVEERIRQTEGAVKGLQSVDTRKTEAYQALEIELERERRKREELEQSKEKVGEVLLSVLDMNQHLVDQCSQSASATAVPTLTKKKKKVRRVSSSSSAAAAAPSTRPVPGGSGRLYTAPTRATTATATRSTFGRSTAASKARRKASTAAATTSRAVPSSSSSSTVLQFPFLPAPHRKTFNMLAALSQAVRQCKSREPKQVLDALYELIVHEADYDPHKSERTAFPTAPPAPSSSIRCSRMHPPSQSELILDAAPSPCSDTWSPPRGRAFRSPPHATKSTTRGEEDLTTLIHLVEQDLDDLNQRYQDLVDRARRTGRGDGAEEDEEEGEGFQPDELKNLLETIQTKEHKLKLLKLKRRKMLGSITSTSRSRPTSAHTAAAVGGGTTSPLYSPTASRRASDRMSFLSGIRGASALQSDDFEPLT